MNATEINATEITATEIKEFCRTGVQRVSIKLAEPKFEYSSALV